MAALSIIHHHLGTPLLPVGRWSRLSRARLLRLDSCWSPLTAAWWFVASPCALCLSLAASSNNWIHFQLSGPEKPYFTLFISLDQLVFCRTLIQNWIIRAEFECIFLTWTTISGHDRCKQPALCRAPTLTLSLHRTLRKGLPDDGPFSLPQNPSLTFTQTHGVSWPAGESSGWTESSAGQKEEKGTLILLHLRVIQKHCLLS